MDFRIPNRFKLSSLFRKQKDNTIELETFRIEAEQPGRVRLSDRRTYPVTIHIDKCRIGIIAILLCIIISLIIVYCARPVYKNIVDKTSIFFVSGKSFLIVDSIHSEPINIKLVDLAYDNNKYLDVLGYNKTDGKLVYWIVRYIYYDGAIRYDTIYKLPYTIELFIISVVDGTYYTQEIFDKLCQ